MDLRVARTSVPEAFDWPVKFDAVDPVVDILFYEKFKFSLQIKVIFTYRWFFRLFGLHVNRVLSLLFDALF